MYVHDNNISAILVHPSRCTGSYTEGYSAEQVAGTVRFNEKSHNFELYDGYGWSKISMEEYSIGLTDDAQEAMDWARKKMKEEKENLELANINPSFKSLFDEINEKQNQLNTLKALIKSEINE